MRVVLGIILGLIAGLVVAVIGGVVAVGATFTLPPGLDPANSGQVLTAFANMPAATQIALAADWTVTAFVAALVAKAVSRSSLAAWIAALIVAAYFGLGAFMMPLQLPLWIAALWVIGPLFGGFIGNRLIGAGPAVVEAFDEEDEAGSAPLEP